MFNYSFEITPRDWGKIRATVNFVIEGVYAVKDYKIMDNDGQLWVAAPQEQALEWTNESGDRVARPKLDENGKQIHYHRTAWLGEKPEGSYRTAEQEEVYNEMIKAYEAEAQTSNRGAAARSQSNRNADEAGGRSSGRKLWNRNGSM